MIAGSKHRRIPARQGMVDRPVVIQTHSFWREWQWLIKLVSIVVIFVLLYLFLRKLNFNVSPLRKFFWHHKSTPRIMTREETVKFIRSQICTHPDIIPANKVTPLSPYEFTSDPRFVPTDKEPKLVFVGKQLFNSTTSADMEMRIQLLAKQTTNFDNIYNPKFNYLLQRRMTLMESHLVHFFRTLLINVKAINAAKNMRCLGSADFSIGKYIAHHVLEGGKMPVLIRIGVDTNIGSQHIKNIKLVQKAHIVPNHFSVLVVDEESEALQTTVQQVIALTSKYPDGTIKMSEDKAQLIKLFRQLNPIICDAWLRNNERFNARRTEGDFFNTIARYPNLLDEVRVITPKTLENPVVRELVDIVFHQESEFWERIHGDSEPHRLRLE